MEKDEKNEKKKGNGGGRVFSVMRMREWMDVDC